MSQEQPTHRSDTRLEDQKAGGVQKAGGPKRFQGAGTPGRGAAAKYLARDPEGQVILPGLARPGEGDACPGPERHSRLGKVEPACHPDAL